MQERNEVRVRMFNSFELEYQGKVLSESVNRSQKLWLLLAYIICFRHSTITQKMLLDNVWGSNDYTAANVLKIALFRLRQMLSEAFGEELGHAFIVCRNKQYSIGEAYDVICDFEEFENGLQEIKLLTDEAEQREKYKTLLEQYRGEFLMNYSGETWTVPIATYCRSMYQEVIRDCLAMCEQKKDYESEVKLLNRAVSVIKYEESFYVALLRALFRTKRYKETLELYERLSDMLMITYDETPSKEAKKLYHEAMHALNKKSLTIKELPAVIREQDEGREALYCEFDLFKVLCRAYLRGAKRSGTEISISLIDITDLQDRPLPQRSQERCVENLKKLLCSNLRSGDAVSMCAPAQFVVLLHNAEKENARLVTERIKKAFYRQYPHTPAKLNCYVENLKSR